MDLELTPDGQGYAILRSFGNIVSFGNVHLENSTYQPFGWDIARALLLTGNDQGYLLDGFGGIHTLGSGPKYRCEEYGEPDRMVDLEMDREGNLWLLDREGRVYSARPVKE